MALVSAWWLPLFAVGATSCLWPRDARELTSETDADTDTDTDTAGLLHQDTFAQGTDALDLLFVIDTSCSMQEEINRLEFYVNEMFIELHAGPVDYHVGAINTNMDDPQFQGRLHVVDGLTWVESTTIDAGLIAAGMVAYEIDQHFDEKGFDASHAAIEVLGDAANAGFYRDDANLGIVVLSDENDHSTDQTVSTYTAWISSLKTPPYRVSFHTIVGDDLGGTTCSTAIEPGAAYMQVASSVGGLFASICATDYSAAVTEMTRYSLGITDRFALSLTPVPDTLAVTAETGDGDLSYAQGVDFAYEAGTNAVVFTAAPPPLGATVVVAYQPAD